MNKGRIGRRACLRAICLIVAVGFGVSVGSALAQEGSSAEKELTFFYKDPDPARVAHIISDPSTNLPGAQPPLMGFLAVVFQRYPKDIGKMIPDGLPLQEQQSVAIALRLAGQNDRAKSLAERLGAAGVNMQNLDRMPTSIDAIQPVGPSQFDFLWGASFASGDPRYCSKILARVVALGNVGGNAEDMLAIVKAYGPGMDLRWVVTKRGQDKAREIIIVSVGMWSLASNAKSHVFVKKVIDDYIASHPDEPTAKAFKAL